MARNAGFRFGGSGALAAPPAGGPSCFGGSAILRMFGCTLQPVSKFNAFRDTRSKVGEPVHVMSRAGRELFKMQVSIGEIGERYLRSGRVNAVTVVSA